MCARTAVFGVVLAVSLIAAPAGRAEPRQSLSPGGAQDAISVIGHVELSGDSARWLLTGVHWRKNYLYLELADRRAMIAVDVTNAAKPVLAGEFSPPDRIPNEHVAAVVGQAVLMTESAAESVFHSSGTVRVFSFADPAHPKLVREFTHVSAMLKDESRGLTYLTGDGGLWILLDRPARDLQLERQYDHDVGQNQ